MAKNGALAESLEGYTPDALRVDVARQAIVRFVSPLDETETIPLRQALGRVLATGAYSASSARSMRAFRSPLRRSSRPW